MTPTAPDPPLLDAARAAFLAGPVSINVASRDAALVPSVARAYGCRVDAGRRVTLFLAEARAAAVLRDLAAGAPIAVIFSRPRTHVSLQLKADRAELMPLTEADRAIMHAYADAFGAEVRALAHSAAFAEKLMQGCFEAAVAARFTPTTLFEQTPGPRAGARLEPRP